MNTWKMESAAPRGGRGRGRSKGFPGGAAYHDKGRLGVLSDKGTDQANGCWAWSLPAAREGGNPRFPQIDANFLRQFAEKLRRSCDPVATPAGGSGGGGVAEPECSVSPQDSKILTPVNAAEDGAGGAAPSTIRAEGGMGEPRHRIESGNAAIYRKI